MERSKVEEPQPPLSATRIARDQSAAQKDSFTSPAAVTTETLPNKMTISYEREGRCLWHLECATNPLRCSPMFVVAHEPERSVVECTSCHQRGYYPVGRLGEVCSEVIGNQSTGAQRHD